MTQIKLEDLEKLSINKTTIVAADEVGWGSLAGPLVICAVKAPIDWQLDGLNDSKKLTPKKRREMKEKLTALVKLGEIEYILAERSNLEIDSLGAAPCLHSCYEEVFTRLAEPNQSEDYLLITDGNLKFDNLLKCGYDVCSLVSGDALVPAISAASIIAKTYRDSLMVQRFHPEYPQYHWDSNMGYASKEHKDALRKHGFSPFHRMSYKVKL